MPSFGGGRVAATEWRRVVDACSDQLRKLHGLREGVLHYTREDHDLGAQCVLLDSNQPHDVVFMSRSLEESTGLSSASVIGKSQLEFMCPSIHWLDDLFNGAERRYVLDFYHSCMRSPPVYGKEEDSVLSLMVFVKATGTPFWALVHTLPVKLAEGEAPPKAASYILHMVVPLEAPVPDSIWIHEAGEARLAAKANIEAIRPFLDQAPLSAAFVRPSSTIACVPPVVQWDASLCLLGLVSESVGAACPHPMRFLARSVRIPIKTRSLVRLLRRAACWSLICI